MQHVSTLLTAQQTNALLGQAALVAKFGNDLSLWDEDEVRRALCRSMRFPWIEADHRLVDQQAFAAHPEACREHEFLVTYRGDISLHVFMPNPFHGPTIRRLRNLFHREIHPVGTSSRSFLRTLTWLEQRVDSTPARWQPKEDTSAELISWNYRPSMGVAFVGQVLETAYGMNASDVFFETYPDRLDIRFKIGGRCMVMPPIEARHATQVIGDAKVFNQMSARVRRGYRDGSSEMRMADGNILNFRCVAQRTDVGETVTIRLLDPKVVTTLSRELPFPPRVMDRMKAVLRKKEGIIIVTGPTGSGKSTTLWRVLFSFDPSEKKIVTIEQPIEYKFDRFVQIPVKLPGASTADSDYPETFAAALQSCLRAAPDVLLVGEMRDKETVEVAIEGALTGHLLATTLHTPDAIGAFARLFDKGASALSLRQTVLAVTGQRLAARLCRHCRTPVPISDAEKAHYDCYKSLFSAPTHVYRRNGCPACKNTGVEGRELVMEVLVLSPSLKRMITEDLDEAAMRAAWIAEGGVPIGARALELAAEGLIAYEDARDLDGHFIA